MEPDIEEPVVAVRVSVVLEMPKSAILATMYSFNNTFWGLRSRCTTACLHECKNCMPCATWGSGRWVHRIGRMQAKCDHQARYLQDPLLPL